MDTSLQSQPEVPNSLLSQNALYWLRKWGHFAPIWSCESFKGWALLDDFDERERNYYGAATLRQMAAAALELAAWLDATEILPEQTRHACVETVADQITTFEKNNVYLTPDL